MKDIDFAKTKSIATRETPVVFRIYYNENYLLNMIFSLLNILLSKITSNMR